MRSLGDASVIKGYGARVNLGAIGVRWLSSPVRKTTTVHGLKRPGCRARYLAASSAARKACL